MQANPVTACRLSVPRPRSRRPQRAVGAIGPARACRWRQRYCCSVPLAPSARWRPAGQRDRAGGIEWPRLRRRLGKSVRQGPCLPAMQLVRTGDRSAVHGLDGDLAADIRYWPSRSPGACEPNVSAGLTNSQPSVCGVAGRSSVTSADTTMRSPRNSAARARPPRHPRRSRSLRSGRPLPCVVVTGCRERKRNCLSLAGWQAAAARSRPASCRPRSWPCRS
jgi:hypothetical protein